RHHPDSRSSGGAGLGCRATCDSHGNVLIALLDINNFYVSCERVMNPALVGRPVVVLSNNDGVAIARSNEAKALGIGMGQPAHELRGLVRSGRLRMLSSNYTLYGDMSARVMQILAERTPAVEVYSIDEAFFDLEGIRNPAGFCADLVTTIGRWTGLPCCVGVGPTKTLAKLANYAAKQASRLAPAHTSVVDFTARHARDPVLDASAVDQVWGVGPRIAARLAKDGILTAGQLRDAQARRLRHQYSVVVERTILELRGQACLALEMTPPPRKQIVCAKSFGAPVSNLGELRQALAHYVAIAAGKLRRQQCVAGHVQVWLATNPFNERITQYSRANSFPLPRATADTGVLST